MSWTLYTRPRWHSTSFSGYRDTDRVYEPSMRGAGRGVSSIATHQPSVHQLPPIVSRRYWPLLSECTSLLSPQLCVTKFTERKCVMKFTERKSVTKFTAKEMCGEIDWKGNVSYLISHDADHRPAYFFYFICANISAIYLLVFLCFLCISFRDWVHISVMSANVVPWYMHRLISSQWMVVVYCSYWECSTVVQ